MRVAIYLAHPRIDSFNRALFDAVVDELRTLGVEARPHDLYAEGFDPLVRAEETETVDEILGATEDLVQQHRTEVGQMDALVFIHPNWWGMPPAVMTGWIQRVLAPAVAYKLDTSSGEPVGLLRATHALILNTSDTPAQREHDEFGDPLEQIWGSCVLPYVGVSDVRRVVFRTVSDSTDEERQAWLAQARLLANTLVTEHTARPPIS